MATYPTLPTAFGSDPKPIASITIDRSEDGMARGRSFYTSDKHKMSVVHEWIDATQKATLDAFYATNRLLTFDYTSPADSVLRTCMFANPISYKREYGSYWTATVELEQQ